MCYCKNIEIGSYDNQVVVVDLPEHMSGYGSIGLDACVAEEVKDLWSLGITTTGCCCGHNKLPGFIGVVHADIPQMKDLGYEVAFNPSRPGDEDSFQPKSV